MENWSDSFFQVLEAMANEVEHFLADIAKEVNEMVEAIAAASEELADQMQMAATDAEQHLTSIIDPILEAYLGFEIVIEENAQNIIQTADPILNNHPACVGCRHYHGQVYGNNLLICGMHPYGWEGEQCPDWQSTWKE